MQFLTNAQSKLVERAMQVALGGEMRKMHGCVIADKTKPISCSSNDTRSYVRRNVMGSMHAEVGALLDFLKLRKKKCATGLDVWVVRISRKTGKLTSSRPCKSCLNILKTHGIRRVWYSCNDGSINCEYMCNIDIDAAHETEVFRDNNLCTEKIRFD